MEQNANLTYSFTTSHVFCTSNQLTAVTTVNGVLVKPGETKYYLEYIEKAVHAVDILSDVEVI